MTSDACLLLYSCASTHLVPMAAVVVQGKGVVGAGWVVAAELPSEVGVGVGGEGCMAEKALQAGQVAGVCMGCRS
jgi:hypothetical protein